MKTALLIPTGVAFRNFICTGFLDQLNLESDVVILHDLPEELIQDEKQRCSERVAWFPLERYHEGVYRYILRRTFLWGHMRTCNTRAMQLMLEKYSPKGWSPRQIADRIAWTASKSAANSRRVRRLVDLHDQFVKMTHFPQKYAQLWQELQPDIILCTDQRPVQQVPAVLAARRLGIPVGTFIFSWDNLSSKGRMPTDFDFYLVWSENMREELLRFYPHLHPATIHVVGSPQFEPYADPGIFMSREAFCKEIGADPQRPLLCYAGEDISTVPDGEKHLEILCQLIRDGAIHGNPQVIARPAPIDTGERFRSVLQKYPEIIWCPARWRRKENQGWEKAVGTREDIALLANTIRHSALCVNVVSTMTLDFALLGKPTVSIAFDASHPPAHGKPVWEVLFQFEHYRPIVELRAARFAHSPTQLAEDINYYLENSDSDQAARHKLIELEIQLPLLGTSQRITQELKKISSAPCPSLPEFPGRPHPHLTL